MKDYTYEPISMSLATEALALVCAGQEAAEAVLEAAWERERELGRRRGLGPEEMETIDACYACILERLRGSDGMLR